MSPKAKPQMSARLTATWHNHPLFTLGTIVSLFTLITLGSPWINSAFHYFETADEAKQREASLRALIANDERERKRENAWARVQSIKNSQIALRNRVNDCDIKKDKRDTMTPLERQACKQYQDEFDDAVRQFNQAQKDALDLTNKP